MRLPRLAGGNIVLTACCLHGALLGACTPEEAETGLLVSLDAEPDVRQIASSLEVEVAGRTDEMGWGLPHALRADVSGEDAWPVRIAVEPAGRAEERGVQVTVRALDAGGRARLVTRAESRFLPGRWLLLRLVLQDSCLQVACPSEQGCRNGSCASPWQDPETLPDALEGPE